VGSDEEFISIDLRYGVDYRLSQLAPISVSDYRSWTDSGDASPIRAQPYVSFAILADGKNGIVGKSLFDCADQMFTICLMDH